MAATISVPFTMARPIRPQNGSRITARATACRTTNAAAGPTTSAPDGSDEAIHAVAPLAASAVMARPASETSFVRCAARPRTNAASRPVTTA